MRTLRAYRRGTRVALTAPQASSTMSATVIAAVAVVALWRAYDRPTGLALVRFCHPMAARGQKLSHRARHGRTDSHPMAKFQIAGEALQWAPPIRPLDLNSPRLCERSPASRVG
jgi:hypothetical protein